MTNSHDSCTKINDWTVGKPGIAYQHCAPCNTSWYHKREFCPSCGNNNVISKQASGRGIVEAITQVYRVPIKALRDEAPYAVVLVRTDEGFLLMGHAESVEVKIGDHVAAHYRKFANSECIPIFR